MSEYFYSVKSTIKKYFVFYSSLVLIAYILVSVLAGYYQQHQVAEHFFNPIKSTAPNISSSDDLAKLINDTRIVSATFETASGMQYLFQRSSGHALLAQYRFQTAQNQLYIVQFNHPITTLLTSLAFWVFFSLWLVSSVLIYRRQLTVLHKKTAEIRQLEQWAYMSRIATDNSQELVEANGSISMAIRQLQQRLIEAEQSGGRVDHFIRRRALLDSETGIGNREYFNNRLEAMLSEADLDTRGAVMFIQLKELDVVFSLYGHQQALALLENCIEQIKNRMIELPKHYFISRRGDYDLALLLPGLYAEETEKLADKLITAINKVQLPIGANKDEFCHIGISYFNHKRKPYEIMAEADMALRSAQLQGPSQWFMYDTGEVASESAKGSLRWRTFLNWALDNDAFDVFFQPVISAETDDIVHHEVLAKVRDKEGKLISARVFWPMAKKCGLSAKVDLLVMRKLCLLLSTRKKHLEKCSINVSVDALLSADFVSRLEQLIKEYPQVADRLIIEVSEYHLVSHLNELKPVLPRITRLGAKLLVDKVGQFVVGLDYLKTAQVDFMKLHRAIVHRLPEKPENQVFIQSLKVMADDAKVKIFALGVETQDEWQTLIKLGIDGGQGHLFTEPVSLEQASGQN